MSERGVFAVDRGIWDHPLFAAEPFTQREAWQWLISEASFKPRARNIAGRVVTLQRGQLAASVRFMGDRWGWSKSSVDRFLVKLKTETMIGTDSGTGILVITIHNYDKYQRVSLPAGTQAEPETGTMAGQQRDKTEDTKGIEDTKAGKPALERAPAKPVREKSQGVRLPSDWRPSPEAWAFAVSKIGAERATAALDRFCDHWAAKPGEGGRKLNWDATWRNWIRRDAEQRGPPRFGQPRPGSREDRQERLANVLNAIDPRTRPAAHDDRPGEGPDPAALRLISTG